MTFTLLKTKEWPEKKWFIHGAFSLNISVAYTSSVPVHLHQDKENKLKFGISEKIVIAVMNETGVPLVQTSASRYEQHWVHQRKVQVELHFGSYPQICQPNFECQSFITKE